MSKINKLFLFSLIFVFAFSLSSVVFAQGDSISKSAISISNFKANVLEDNTISGSFTLTNISSKPLTGVYYYLTLEKAPVLKSVSEKEGELVLQPIVAKYQIDKPFTLGIQEKRNFSFVIKYPASIKSGKYQLDLYISNSLGSENYAASMITLTLSGDGSMLEVDSSKCRIVGSGGKEYESYVGTLFQPNEKPKVKCQVKNPSNKAVDFYIKHQTGILHVLSYGNQVLQSSQSKDTYHIEAGQTKEIEFTLPVESKPNIYESFVQFVDSKTHQVVSPYLVLRWTIKGEAARIDELKVSPFKASYKQGEAVLLTYSYSPSPDLYWRDYDENLGTDLTNAKLIFTLYSNKNKICAQKEVSLEKIDSYVSGESTSLTLNTECQAQRLEARIKKADNVLASYTLAFPQKKQTASVSQTQNQKQAQGSHSTGFILLTLLAILLVALPIVYKEKLGLRNVIILVLIVLLLYFTALIFMSRKAKADSGSLASQSVKYRSSYNHSRYITVSSDIPSFNIEDYKFGQKPQEATVHLTYQTGGSVCDNDDIVVFVTLKLQDKSYRIKINNKGIGRFEYGSLSINLLDYSTFASKFSSLPVGSYNFIVDVRAVNHHIEKPDLWLPGCEVPWRDYGHCGTLSANKSYESGWNGPGTCTCKRCYYSGWDYICDTYSNPTYSPLIFNLPFTVLESTPTPPPVPSCSATLSPSKVNKGDNLTLSVTSQNCSSASYSCSGVLEGFSGSIDCNGSVTIGPIEKVGQGSCTVTVEGAEGSTGSCSASTVKVLPKTWWREILPWF